MCNAKQCSLFLLESCRYFAGTTHIFATTKCHWDRCATVDESTGDAGEACGRDRSRREGAGVVRAVGGAVTFYQVACADFLIEGPGNQSVRAKSCGC